MSKKILMISIILIGFLTGIVGSQLVQNNQSPYCNGIEQDIRQNQSFKGSIACYPPGVLDVNVSEQVDENAELRCVCRIIDRSGIRLFPVAVSN